MRSRRGFTLLELIVSIAVTGVIALLVYASAAAGFDTRDALARHRAGAEAELRTRALMMDALRHGSDEANPGEPAFELVDAANPQGLPADQLTFLTRGIGSPLGASALWRVTVAATATGVVMNASPADADPRAQPALIAAIDGARGLDIETMTLADRTWTSAWASTGQMPAAVRLTLYDATGRVVGAPLVARVGLEAAR
jgi:prepilin-type N-terminal cleavage/methylation domain-containing protein